VHDPGELVDSSGSRPAATALLLRELVMALAAQPGADLVASEEDLSGELSAIGYVAEAGVPAGDESVSLAQQVRHQRKRL
jgi:hypothetical protein